jgi:flagellar biosynthetic protein FliR
MLQDITVSFIFHMMLIFARIGTIMSLLPGIGDKSVMSRARLGLALATSFVLYPLLDDIMPQYPTTTAAFMQYLACEMLIGLFLGLIIRIVFLTIHTVGLVLSMQSGLGSAMFFDPSQKEQVSVFSYALLLIVSMAIFATDTHYAFIEGAIDSYSKFPVGKMPDVSDMSNVMSRIVSDSFVLAFKMVSPFLIVSLAILAGSGILARLMPNLQVFFVLTPVQILSMYITLFIVIQVLVEKVIIALQSAAKLQGI